MKTEQLIVIKELAQLRHNITVVSEFFKDLTDSGIIGVPASVQLRLADAKGLILDALEAFEDSVKGEK